MAGNHLREPLDYLYEELPPDKMAEVRRHLSECPDCRAQMRVIRETVKLYRQMEHPIAPVGLSAKTIKNALEIARGHDGKANATPKTPSATGSKTDEVPPAKAEPASPRPQAGTAMRRAAFVSETAAPPAEGNAKPSREAYGETEFARLKEEMLGEIHRGGWRSWLFHPAWTVAASVIFLCALLVHFSPRMNKPETVRIPVLPHREESATQLRDRERLPASHPPPELPDAPAPEASPILQEAAAMNEPLEFLPASIMNEPASSAAEETGIAAPAPKPARPPRMIEGLLAQPPLPESETGSGQPGEEDTVRVRARPPTAAYAIHKKHETPPLAGPEEETAAKVFVTPEFSRPPAPAVKESHAPAPVPPAEPENPEAPENSSAAPEPAAPVVIMDALSPDDVPQIVPRPTPINVQERVRSLTALIGMQIASGELADARQALGLLERYDAKAAEELRALLNAVPEPRDETKPKASIGSTLPKDAPRPYDKPAPPVTPTESPTPPVQPEAVQNPEVGVVPQAAAETEVSEAHFDRSPLGWIEPPEDPPMSTVSVPASAAADEAPGAQNAPASPEQPDPPAEPAAPSGADGVSKQIDDGEVPETAAAIPPLFHHPDIAQNAEEEKTAAPPAKAAPAAGHDVTERLMSVADLYPGEERDPVPAGKKDVTVETETRVALPKVMEPAVTPEGFMRVRTGPAQTTWVAVGTENQALVEPAAATNPVAAVERIVSERVVEAAEKRPVQSIAPQPAAYPVYEYVIPATTVSVPVQPVVVVPMPAPQYRSRAVSPPRRRSSEPEPYLRDY